MLPLIIETCNIEVQIDVLMEKSVDGISVQKQLGMLEMFEHGM